MELHRESGDNFRTAYCILKHPHSGNVPSPTRENLDAVTTVTYSFKMADAFAGDQTGGTVAQTSALTVDISVRQGRA